MEHEISLVQSFIVKERQQRYLNLIATKKGRIKFRSYIPHFKDLNPNFYNFKITNQGFDEVYKILRAKGSPNFCYVISEHSEFDQKTILLYDALASLFNSGISFFLSCLPGQIAYYEGEDFNTKIILIK